MRQHLLLALMANMTYTTIAISLSLTPFVLSSGAVELCAQTATRRAASTTAPTPRMVGFRMESGQMFFTNEPQEADYHRGATRSALGGSYARSRGTWTTLSSALLSTPEIESAIAEASARHGLDANLIRSVIRAESAFDPFAVSRMGAEGLMQLMPATAAELNVSNPFDAAQNIDGGVRHLKQLLEHFDGDLELSLAAYNAGEGAVRRAGGVPNFAETRNYVRRITGLALHANETPGRRMIPAAPPATLFRDEHGVLTLSNTD